MTAVALIIALAVLAGGAMAKTKPARLDPSFGRQGSFMVATPAPSVEPERYPRTNLAVAPSNKSYVQQGPWVIGFGADGKPDRGFGDNGRVRVAPKGGSLVAVSDLAVDSHGRILVAGTLEPVKGLTNQPITGKLFPPLFPQAVTEAFVIRYLPNGSLDPTFGPDGEVVTTFGAPRPLGPKETPSTYERPVVSVTQIEVDADDRPVISGRYSERVEGCFYKSSFDQAFVARLDPDGTVDTGFGSGGIAKIASETPIALSPAPGGNWATLSGPEVCEHGLNGLPSQLSVLTETGSASAGLDPGRPPLKAGENAVAVDAQGRILFTEREEFEQPPPRVVRLTASGDLDTSFGKGGAVGVGRLGASPVAAIAVEASGRIVVGFGISQLEIGRLTTSGKLEGKFGRKGVLRTSLGSETGLQALAIDSKGRIVAAGTALGGELKTGQGIGIARFLPGS
jgi:uncharacterized delta-60 repeat protein